MEESGAYNTSCGRKGAMMRLLMVLVTTLVLAARPTPTWWRGSR
jgi:hypothetical protein